MLTTMSLPRIAKQKNGREEPARGEAKLAAAIAVPVRAPTASLRPSRVGDDRDDLLERPWVRPKRGKGEWRVVLVVQTRDLTRLARRGIEAEEQTQPVGQAIGTPVQDSEQQPLGRMIVECREVAVLGLESEGQVVEVQVDLRTEELPVEDRVELGAQFGAPPEPLPLRIEAQQHPVAVPGCVLHPAVAEMIAKYPRAEVTARLDKASVPFSPIARPEDLYDDPQLDDGIGLLETTLPAGVTAKLPRIPLEMGNHDFGLRRNPPQIGEDTTDLLAGLGYGEDEIAKLVEEGVVAVEG